MPRGVVSGIREDGHHPVKPIAAPPVCPTSGGLGRGARLQALFGFGVIRLRGYPASDVARLGRGIWLGRSYPASGVSDFGVIRLREYPTSGLFGFGGRPACGAGLSRGARFGRGRLAWLGCPASSVIRLRESSGLACPAWSGRMGWHLRFPRNGDPGQVGRILPPIG